MDKKNYVRSIRAGGVAVLLIAIGVLVVIAISRAYHDTESTMTPKGSKEGADTVASASTVAGDSRANRLSDAPVKSGQSTTTTTSSTAPRASFVSEREALDERARHGDAHAASTLFDDAKKCYRAHVVWKNANSEDRTNPLNVPVQSALNEDQRRAAEGSLTEIQKAIDLLKQPDGFCAGVGEEMLDGRMVDMEFRAAELGDANAANCYVSGSFDVPESMMTPTFVNDYREKALRLLGQRFALGDVKAIDIYANMYSGVYLGMPQNLNQKDPVQSYRYYALERLVADAPSAARLDTLLQMKAEDLSTSDVTAANDWAAQTRNQYFSASSDINFNDLQSCSY